jgi:chromosome segregation ATPase
VSAATQLKSDVLELEREHDALTRTIDRKHAELDSLNVHIRARTDDLARIRAEIAKVKAHFGV